MTISISPQAWYDLWYQETVELSQHPDPDDALDVMYKCPLSLGSGYWREIELREGLEVIIGDYRLFNRFLTPYPEWEADWLEYHFHFSGEHQTDHCSLGARKFLFSGSGLARKTTSDSLDTQPYLEVIILIKPETLRSFRGDPAGELPRELQPLIRPSDQEQYCRTGIATLAMQTVAQSIIQCPYQGISKRLYLESKALELIGLLVAQEVEIRSGTITSQSLKSDVIDRVYQARSIVLQRLDNPPSLMELARQVGLNECTLKRGFQQIFSTTVFGYLHNYRMEQARQLLGTGAYKVEKVARIVGYRNRSAFSRAFHKHFGVPAQDCMKRGSSKIWF